MSDQTYYFKRVNKDLLPDLQFLFKDVFGLAYSLSYIENKIDTFNTPASYLGFLAYHPSGEVAGYYGLLACYKTIEGELTLCAQSADTMVSPKHQGQGLFKDLHDLTMSLAKELDVKVIFGYPNKVSFPLFVKALRWKNARTLQFLFVNIKTIPLAKFFYKFNKLEPLYIALVKMCLQLFFAKGQAFNDEACNKSLAYKLRNKRNFTFRISNTTIWVSILNGIWIGKTDGGLKMDSIIKKLKPLCFLLGLSQIQFMTDPLLDDAAYKGTISKTTELPLIFKFLDADYAEKVITFEGFEGDMF